MRRTDLAMPTVEQTRVEDLLANAADDPARVPEFLTALLNATVLVPRIARPTRWDY